MGFDFKHGSGGRRRSVVPDRVDHLAGREGAQGRALEALRALSLGNTDRINKWTTSDYLAMLEVAGRVGHGTYDRTGEVRIPA